MATANNPSVAMTDEEYQSEYRLWGEPTDQLEQYEDQSGTSTDLELQQWLDEQNA